MVGHPGFGKRLNARVSAPELRARIHMARHPQGGSFYPETSISGTAMNRKHCLPAWSGSRSWPRLFQPADRTPIRVYPDCRQVRFSTEFL